MTLFSRHYDLNIFGWGSPFSGAEDRRRFTIIDNQMAFIADQIGDGRIEGWNITELDPGSLNLSLSVGSGLIDRFMTRTLGNIDFTVADNRTSKVYVRRKLDIIGGFSDFSNLATVLHSDSTAPGTPSNLISEAVSFDTITLSWDNVPEVDLSFYIIQRSLDNNVFINHAETSVASYTDTDLVQNTLYYYRIKSVDLSGNQSANSAVSFVKTIKDLTQPINGLFFQVFPGDTLVKCLWEPSPSKNLDHYEIIVQELNTAYEPVGDPTVHNVSLDKTFLLIDGLNNGVRYRVSLITVNINDVESEPIDVLAVPEHKKNPSEVSDIDITYEEGLTNDINVVMNLNWFPTIDPYADFPTTFRITLLENGTRYSEPIEVVESFDRKIQLIPFNEGGQIVFESIKENTIYLVKISTVDDSDNESAGFIARTRAPSFKPVPVPSFPSVEELTDRSLFAMWTNSVSEFFSHNLLSIMILDLETQVETILLTNENIGTANSYLIDSALWQENAEYQFTIVVVDIFGNQSLSFNFSFNTSSPESVPLPTAPSNFRISARNKSVTLTWDNLTNANSFVVSYNIYRTIFSFTLLPEDFEVIQNVPESINTYIDYEVENDSIYAYKITAVDVFGRESDSPAGNLNSFFAFSIAQPTESPNFEIINNLAVNDDTTSSSAGAHDAVLTWTPVPGTFDGYEIWKSIGNKYSFMLLIQLGPATNTYVDEDALLIDGTEYHYLIRQFRNEGEIFVTESNVAPSGSVCIANVTASSGSVSINHDCRREIKDIDDPVREVTIAEINSHKHALEDDGTDKRIDLRSDIIVTSWVTLDFKRYTTDEDIEGATTYDVKIIGIVNRDFFKTTDVDGNETFDEVSISQTEAGLPPVLYEISPDEGVITFEFPLFTTSALDDPTPFSSEPEIIVKLLGVSEINNTLPANRMGTISATQIRSGILAKPQMPVVKHAGRITESLIPTPLSTTTDDDITYTIEGADVSLGSAITFYDVIQYQTDNELLAASSNGILKSDDFGATWVSSFSTATAPCRLLFSSAFNKYFVFTNKRVFATAATADDWKQMAGLPNVKIIRDIIMDPNNNLYLSTDLGVYKLNLATADQFFSWEQTSIFGPKSTESYAMIYDSNNSRILASNEFGLLESKDSGISWAFTSDFAETKKIFNFVGFENHIFALTKDEIWRLKPGQDFVKVADIDVNLSRKMILFNDRLYITTDSGLMATSITDNLLDDVTLNIARILPEINLNAHDVPVYSLNVIQDHLFIGTDQRLFILDNKGNVWIQFDQVIEAVPSVFVNNILQKIGFRYNNSDENKSISFDERLLFNDTVTVANQYKIYKTQHNGWAGQKFDAPLSIFINGIEEARSGEIKIDVEQFSGFQFPDFSERNSNFTGAEKYKTAAQADIDRLVGVVTAQETGVENEFSLNDGEELFDLVASVMTNIEKFLSQLFEEARVFTTASGEEVPVEIPAILVELKKVTTDLVTGSVILGDTFVTVNVSDGICTFESSFTKYDVIEIDIRGATVKNIGTLTHREVEDEMELVNSGLPSVLSQVKQANVVKTGIFNEKKWPGQQNSLSTPVQATYIVPNNNAFYEVLDSDIDFTIEVENVSLNDVFPYPADVIYIAKTGLVLVGGSTGIFSINITNLDIDPIPIGDRAQPFIKQFIEGFDKIYALAERNLFSSDDGLIWIKEDRTGLPNKLFSVAIRNNNFIIGAEDGIYFKSRLADSWTKGLDSSTPVNLLFNPDLVFAIVDGGKIVSSVNGSDYIDSGTTKGLEINDLAKYRSAIFSATNSGLYVDDGTFYGKTPEFHLQDILGDSLASKQVAVNDLVADANNRLIAGLSDGRYVIYNGDTYILFSDSNLDTIHKVLIVDGGIWLLGFDLLKIPSLNIPIKITTGAPL